MQYYNDPIEYLLAVIGEKEKYYLNAQSSNPDPRYQSFCKGALQVLKKAKWRVSRTSQNKLDKIHLHYMKQFANSSGGYSRWHSCVCWAGTVRCNTGDTTGRGS